MLPWLAKWADLFNTRSLSKATAAPPPLAEGSVAGGGALSRVSSEAAASSSRHAARKLSAEVATRRASASEASGS